MPNPIIGRELEVPFYVGEEAVERSHIMGLETYITPTSSGIIPETLIETKTINYEYNPVTGKHEAVEKVSELGKYKGGNFFGYSLKSKGAAEVIFYDNAEKAEGKPIAGPIYFTAKESKSFMDPTPVKFKEAIYMKIVSGEIESGAIWADVE